MSTSDETFSKYFYRIPKAVGIWNLLCAFGCFIVAIVKGTNSRLFILLLILGILYYYAGRILKPVGMPKQLLPLDRGGCLLAAGALLLGLQLVIRLVVSDNHFDGSAIDFDFGQKECESEYISDQNETVLHCEQSVAFEFEFNSFGHCLQGALVLLWFPVCHDLFAVNEHLVIARELGAAMVIMYPLYNIIKRIFSDADTFAISSFSNNASEWTYGFCIGIALGLILTAKRLEALTPQEPTEPPEPEYAPTAPGSEPEVAAQKEGAGAEVKEEEAGPVHVAVIKLTAQQPQEPEEAQEHQGVHQPSNVTKAV